MFQICHCGTQPGYAHDVDCPFPLYTDDAASVETWTREYEGMKAAADAGAAHGRAAASWYFDGTSDDADYRRALRGLEDGDPEFYASLPSEPLSGQWADEPTPASVVADAGFSLEDGIAEDLIRRYEDAFSIAVHDTIEAEARRALGEPFETEDGAAYTVAGYPGVAWVITGVPYVNSVPLHMVGDDRIETFEAADLTLLPRADYCGVCGQIGCAHDGYDRDDESEADNG